MNVELFEKINKTVNEGYPFLRANKKREIKRLIFEIVKINKDFNFYFIPSYKSYKQFKSALLALRYPRCYPKYPLKNFYLPEIELNKKDSFIENKDFLKVNKIIVEKKCINSKITKNVIKNNSEVKVEYIESFKELKKGFLVSNYNSRSEKIYVVEEKFDFLKKCPCTKGCISCNYYVLNLGFGCPMECEYCFLQSYQNFDGIILQSNVFDFLNKMIEIFKSSKKRIRIGTGEFSDSLVYDNLTEYSIDISKAVSDHKNIIFEFKTKTSNIENFFKVSPSENIVISYSLNPQEVINVSEHYTLYFKDRIACLKKLSDYGYVVGLHFDPLISVVGWKRFYYDMINDIFSVFSPEEIRWISLGTFRFKPETKKIIENRFKENVILDEEMVLDFDGKLRYPYFLRKEIYSYILSLLKKKKFDLSRVYLCMEEDNMWKEIGLDMVFKW